MLAEDAVAGKHTEEPLEVLGVGAVGAGEDAGEDLGGGEGGVGATLPEGVGVDPLDGPLLPPREAQSHMQIMETASLLEIFLSLAERKEPPSLHLPARSFNRFTLSV